MKQTRWGQFGSLWTPLQQVQTEVNRLFDRFVGDNPAAGFPALNVWEDTDGCYVEAELPGVELKDLEIHVTGGNHLTLKGDRKSAEVEKGVWHRQERGSGTFARTLALPFTVDAEKVEARLENGILTVKLAKHESAKPRKIVVKSE